MTIASKKINYEIDYKIIKKDKTLFAKYHITKIFKI